MTERTTKVLLLAVAVGLWANVATDWLRPVSVHANAGQFGNADQFEQFTHLSLARDRTFRRAVETIIEGCSPDGGYLDGGELFGAYVDTAPVFGGEMLGGYVSGGYVYGGELIGAYVDRSYVSGGQVTGGYISGARISC